jgi:lambda family phage portal protein
MPAAETWCRTTATRPAPSTRTKTVLSAGHYRLNARPNYRVLANITNASFDDVWAEEFQQMIEARFDLIAESEDGYLDASGRNTLTNLVRLAVGGFVITGEVLATAEWMRSTLRPVKTAVQMVSPDRLSNPDSSMDTKTMRRGIERDYYGRPLAYHIRNAHPAEIYDADSYTWKRIPATKPWGRKQVLHIVEQQLPDQSRGIADMVTALKHMKMTKQFKEITLQNAVINASYAAAIESELPNEQVAAMMGRNTGVENYQAAIETFMGMLAGYVSASKNISVDGAKIPHLFPGTKLSMKPMGTPGGDWN